MKYYHATDYSNMESILENGLKVSSWDKVVYMCKKPNEALRFTALRFLEKTVVFEIDIPTKEKDKVSESFDHSESFFKCKAYMYSENVPKEWLSVHSVYKRKDTM